MNRLIIVGNGFDLSLGLKTSYKDFLRSYLVQCVNSSFEKKSNIDMNRSKFYFSDELIDIDIPNGFSQVSFNECIESIKTYEELISFFNEKKVINYKFPLLKEIVKQVSSNSWIDIEIFYYDTLVNLLVGRRSEGTEKVIRDYNNSFNFLKDKLVQYLKSIDLVERNRRITEFTFCYEDIMFGIHHLKKDDKVEIKNVMILDFNYTSTVDKNLYIPHYDSMNIIHNQIHGNLYEEDSVIFGFGDEHDKNYEVFESSRSREVFKNIKSVHYFKYKNYKRLKSFIDSDDYEVYIIGHSCGVSDRTLFNEIFEHKSCKSIRIFHYKSDSKTTDFFEKSIELMRHFKDKVVMRNKIEPFYDGDVIPQLTIRY